MAAHYPASGRAFAPYTGFANAYADGTASIARLVGPEASGTLGCGIARYARIRTTWVLPFDEIVCVLEGAMIVRAAGQEWHAVAGDVLHFPQGEPVEYDVAESVAVFYAKYPVGDAYPPQSA